MSLRSRAKCRKTGVGSMGVDRQIKGKRDYAHFQHEDKGAST